MPVMVAAFDENGLLVAALLIAANENGLGFRLTGVTTTRPVVTTKLADVFPTFSVAETMPVPSVMGDDVSCKVIV